MISHQHRCIFVHIPRTGGSSIEDIIWTGPRHEDQLWMGFVSLYANKYQTGGLQHLLARQIATEVGHEVFGSYFKFAFVRNPWDRAVSQFAYTQQRPDLRALIGMDSKTPFGRYLELIEKHPHVQWKRQVDFVQDEKGNRIVDYIGRFERLAEDARHIFDRLGIPQDRLPHRNASRRAVYPEYYDAEARARVEHLYRDDIAGFDYRFGE